MSTVNPWGKTSDRARRRLVWAAPVLVAGAVVAGVMISGAAFSDASPSLAARSPAQLIADVLSSNASAFSGTVQESANLGLPSLPGERSSASLSWQTFITGTHSARVWVDGPDKQRVALIGELSEADAVHNGADVWTYTSDTNTVTHASLPKNRHGTHDASTDPAKPDARDLTPASVAARALKAVDPTTAVSVDPTQTVAGQDAYTLVVRPRDKQSTVQKVTIAVDARHHIPLAVQVYGAGSSSAFSVGFTDISYATPAASTFAFRTPVGATVSNDPFGTNSQYGEHRHHSRGAAHPAAAAPTTPPAAGAKKSPTVIGHGWTSVLELPAGTGGQSLSGPMLRDLTNPIGSSGARLLHTALVNALVLPDGRTFVGAVSPTFLQTVAKTAR